MENEEIMQQILLEPDHYYNIGFPFDLAKAESEAFNKGYHYGQFASYKKVGEGLYNAVRDPLGIGKLFYTETKTGDLHFSDRFEKLFPFQSPIYSVPAGMMVSIGTGGRRKLIRNLGVPLEIDENLSKEAFEESANANANKFRKRFDGRLNALFSYFRSLEDEGWSFFVALSGGLDSTIIASKANQFLNKPVACTLDLGKSEDSEKSQMIANRLGVQHLVFPTNEEKILDALEIAPSICQDFRDFNVHCAALNILLAKRIKEYVENQEELNKNKIIVLTGDLMNEFTNDYAGEVIDGIEYYKLPRVGDKELQNYLINGLDTSDREISVFRAYGLECIQPFAVLYDLYASVHGSVFQANDPKKLLNSFQIDEGILDFIPKEKLRAQVGSRENMGILGLSHKKGYNNRTFRKKLLENSGYKDGNIPIFVGRYDVEKFTS